MNADNGSTDEVPQTLRALVIDDDAFVRTVVAHQLRGLGATMVATAADGNSAREVLRSQQGFELIVCDLMMPGADGVELLRDIAEAHPDVALILISSADSKLLRSAENIAQNRDLRVLGTLQKPVRTDGLRDLLARIGSTVPRVLPTPRPDNQITEAMVREGIERGEIRIAVQPQVNLASGRLEGAEALARWPRPNGKTVQPDQFLSIAESAGLMDTLTDQIFVQAVNAVRDWQRAGLELRIAINVAAGTLSRPGLPDRITELARAAGVRLSQVMIEVTETGIAGDRLVPLEVLTRFRLGGVELSIDDFGTGYSSLERLSQIPFNELKIDRSFVAAACKDPAARRIIESSVRLAHDLGLRTVAEGIETAEDAQLMRALGCDSGQGYYYARPMPPSALVAWAAAR